MEKKRISKLVHDIDMSIEQDKMFHAKELPFNEYMDLVSINRPDVIQPILDDTVICKCGQCGTYYRVDQCCPKCDRTPHDYDWMKEGCHDCNTKKGIQ